jgi:hypothetical protein
VITFGDAASADGGAPTQVTFTIEPHQEIVRLTVRHQGLHSEAGLEAAPAGWPAVIANPKSLLETGKVLPQAPWEMHAEPSAEQLAENDPS